jgi:Zn-dependent peptidase ImmA (M78 family)
MTQIQMADLYKRLSTAGFPKKFIEQEILPDWWCKEFEETDNAITHAAMYLSRRLNLDMKSLLAIDTPIEFSLGCQPKFKTTTSSVADQIKIPYALAARVSELLAQVYLHPYRSLKGLTAQDLRHQILENHENADLQGLLQLCSSQGIPVVYLDRFPRGCQKFHGMVSYWIDRPVIVVSLKDRSTSRLAFVIAHELGHILKEHLSNTQFLVDNKIELSSNDLEEIEANEFASELLLGVAGIGYQSLRTYQPQELAQYAQTMAKRDRVAPGVVIWNYGWSKGEWSIARQAIKIVEPSANAPVEINQHLWQHLDLEQVSEDNQDYLQAMIPNTISGQA